MTEQHTPQPQRWFLASTKPRLEKVALYNLEQQGFEAYLPLYKQYKKTADGPVETFEPMFPRYIFFRPTNDKQSISVVRSTKGISHLVRFGFEPASLDDELLQRIRQVEQLRNNASLLEISQLKAGQTVLFKNSVFSGLEGIVQKVSSKRVAVLLNILGQPTLVQVDHHHIESVA